jgi:aminoglycoside 6'-N-acetyltransferase
MEITFEPLKREHLPLMQAWLSQAHVSRWWGAPKTLGEVEAEYGPGIDGTEPTSHFLVILDGRAIGMIQWYLWSSYPDEEEDGDIGVLPGEAGLDYLIGEPDCIGQGVGPLVIGRFLDEVVLADACVTGVRTSVHADNRQSWRCLEKAGFKVGSAIPHPQGHLQHVPTLTRAQWQAATSPSVPRAID